MMLNNVIDQIENISTKEEFIGFMQQLILSFSMDQDSWENINLERYLESMAAWLEDTNRKYDKNGINIWKEMAVMMIAGATYE